MIEKFLPFIKKAGDYAVANRPVSLKKYAGTREIEQTRRVESELAGMFVAYCRAAFPDTDYFIATERGNDLDLKEKISKHEYMFVITPIDGSDIYAQKYMVGWTMGIGIWHRGVPKYGMIYDPGNMNHLIYNDADAAYNIYHAFSMNEKEVGFDATSRSKFFIVNALNDTLESGLTWYYANDLILYMIVRNFAFFGHSTLWNFGPILPVANAIGVKMYNVKTGMEFTIDMLDPTMRMADGELFCHPKHLDFVKENTKLLDGRRVAKSVNAADKFQRQSTIEI